MSTLPVLIASALDVSTDAVLASTLAHFGCQAGTVHRLSDGVLKLAASANLPPHIVAIVDTVPIGKGIAGLAAERMEAVSLCNLQTDTSGHAKPAARQTGMEGSLAVPMITEGALRGVLGIAKATSHDWTPEETALLMAIGAELGGRI